MQLLKGSSNRKLMTIIAAIFGGTVVGRTSFDVRYETGQGMILETSWLLCDCSL